MTKGENRAESEREIHKCRQWGRGDREGEEVRKAEDDTERDKRKKKAEKHRPKRINSE